MIEYVTLAAVLMSCGLALRSARSAYLAKSYALSAEVEARRTRGAADDLGIDVRAAARAAEAGREAVGMALAALPKKRVRKPKPAEGQA